MGTDILLGGLADLLSENFLMPATVFFLDLFLLLL